MKLFLKKKTKVAVGKRQEDCYRYESEDGTIIVQFNAGKTAWTWEMGLATNAAGGEIAKKVIEAYIRTGQAALAANFGDSERLFAGFDEAIKVLEVSP